MLLPERPYCPDGHDSAPGHAEVERRDRLFGGLRMPAVRRTLHPRLAMETGKPVMTDLVQVTFDVPEISCAQCGRTITRVLDGRPGVEALRVDVDTRTVHLTYDPAAIGLAAVASVLEEAGYPVVLSTESPSAPERKVPPTESPRRTAARVQTVKVQARGEDFRIVQLQGNLFVCSKAHGSCCCGWTEKERAPINASLYEGEWERRRIRNRLHLTFTGCLGPCAVGNNAMLQLHGRSIWFKDLNDDALIPQVFDYAEAMLEAGQILPPPVVLRDHVYERYLPPPGDQYDLQLGVAADDPAGLERLDPICLMDVDPATARYKLENDGRMFYFCAPSCKRTFERDPAAYING